MKHYDEIEIYEREEWATEGPTLDTTALETVGKLCVRPQREIPDDS